MYEHPMLPVTKKTKTIKRTAIRGARLSLPPKQLSKIRTNEKKDINLEIKHLYQLFESIIFDEFEKLLVEKIISLIKFT